MTGPQKGLAARAADWSVSRLLLIRHSLCPPRQRLRWQTRSGGKVNSILRDTLYTVAGPWADKAGVRLATSGRTVK